MTELAYPSGLSPSKGGSRLQRLRDLLQPRAVYRFRDLAVEGLAFHSSEVRPGTLFFAIPGTVDNGCSYVDEALMRGAVGVVCEKPMNIRVPVLVVEDARRALADAAVLYKIQRIRQKNLFPIVLEPFIGRVRILLSQELV